MITEATTFATIVGLLSAFTSGRKADAIADLADFTAWLIEHNHEELAKVVESNLKASVSIKSLLAQQNAEVLNQLGELGHTMAVIASRMPGFSGVVSAVVPGAELSQQALSILLQMRANGTEFFLISKSFGAPPQLVASNGPAITYTEQQFLNDDLGVLVESELLRRDYNSSGGEMYYFTRAGGRVADACA